MSSSSSAPISLSSKPPSLFGSSVSTLSNITSPAPRKQERQPRKKKPAAGKKKKSQRKPIRSDSEGSNCEGGDFEMANISSEEDIVAPVLIASSASVTEQSKRKTFKFSEDDTVEPVHKLDDEPETKVDSPQSPRKIEVNHRRRHIPISEIVIINRDEEHLVDNKTIEDEENTEENTEETTEESSADDDDGDGETHTDCLEAVIERGLFQLPCTNGLIDTFGAGVKSYVLEKLRGMLNEEPTPDIVLEISDSIDLLRLLGASDPTLDDIGEKMSEGILLYERGTKKLNKGQNLLRSALSDVSSLE